MLYYIVKSVSELCTKYELDISIYADLTGYRINGGTVPPNIVPTPEKPDLVIHDKRNNSIIICELTVPFELNIESARGRKLERYTQLAADINLKGFKCDLICFEVGSRGIITKDNKSQIYRIFKVFNESKVKQHFNKISQIALVSSYIIYLARNEPKWNDMSLLN